MMWTWCIHDVISVDHAVNFCDKYCHLPSRKPVLNNPPPPYSCDFFCTSNLVPRPYETPSSSSWGGGGEGGGNTIWGVWAWHLESSFLLSLLCRCCLHGWAADQTLMKLPDGTRAGRECWTGKCSPNQVWNVSGSQFRLYSQPRYTPCNIWTFH